MKSLLTITLIYVLLTPCRSQTYEVADLTGEHLFTQDIEGPMVDLSGQLYVVNFQRNGTVARVSNSGQAIRFLTLPKGSTANAIQFDSKGFMLLADWTGHFILRADMKTKRIKVFSSAPFNQPNDITINRSNQLFASDPDWKNGTGKLWRIEPSGVAVLLKADMGTTNGITLSKDQRTLFVNESLQRRVWAFTLNQAGEIVDERLIHEFPDYGLDGMKCDASGNLWIARHGKGTVAVLSPEGKFLHEIQLKGKNPSNLVFSVNGSAIYVTVQDRGCIEVIHVR